ncbi:hypothetical protein HJG60_009098 [Phyllostomus discolor]|uniref:Uncharacterized protein n=1 Tax=Phyllostomus discolor TaxID=89673 RepID=A0A833YM86_9CHIR|nr:hypothetical protein HJG60_009098 [Phyllostomus discolor]
MNKKREVCLFYPTKTSLAGGLRLGTVGPSDALSTLGHSQAAGERPPPRPHPACLLPAGSINHCLRLTSKSTSGSRGEKSPTVLDFHGNQTPRATGREGEMKPAAHFSWAPLFLIAAPPPALLLGALLDQSDFIFFFLAGFLGGSLIQPGSDDFFRLLIFVEGYYVVSGGHFFTISKRRPGKEPASWQGNNAASFKEILPN